MHKKEFLPEYTTKKEKINKGHLIRVTDSSVILLRNQEESEMTISKIGTIKLKRSFGSNALKAGMISGAAFGILGGVTADPDASFLGYTAGRRGSGGICIRSGIWGLDRNRDRCDY